MVADGKIWGKTGKKERKKEKKEKETNRNPIGISDFGAKIQSEYWKMAHQYITTGCKLEEK